MENTTENEILSIVPQNHLRFCTAPWYGTDRLCFIGGAGSIGSWLSLFLSRAGNTIHLVDFDTVDAVNLAGQLYSEVHIGKPKVMALAEILNAFSPKTAGITGVKVSNARVEEVLLDTPFVFSCFDSVIPRRILFEKWLRFCADNPKYNKSAIFIDGRLAAENYQIFSCRYSTPEIEAYKKTLYDAGEVQEEVCSYKSTTHMAADIASNMTKVFNNHIANLKKRKRIRCVPNYIFHEALYMYTETLE